MVHLGVVGAGLVLVVLPNVEDVGVGLSDAAAHQVDMLYVGLDLKLLVAPHKLQHRDAAGCVMGQNILQFLKTIMGGEVHNPTYSRII